MFDKQVYKCVRADMHRPFLSAFLRELLSRLYIGHGSQASSVSVLYLGFRTLLGPFNNGARAGPFSLFIVYRYSSFLEIECCKNQREDSCIYYYFGSYEVY